MKIEEIKNQAYLLPWKNNDNPQCFLEITRKCSAGCKSCYQTHGFFNNQNKPLDIIKEEIDILAQGLNLSAIAIVGGEPLEYPQINEVVKYVSQKKITPALFSNVNELNEKRLKELIVNGLQVVYAHIDEQTTFNLAGKLDESLAMEKRQEFAQLLRKFKGKVYGITSAIIGDNDLRYLTEILGWAYKNSDIIKYCCFIIDGHQSKNSSPREVADLVKVIQNKFSDFRINSYLGGTDSDLVHWAQSVSWLKKNKVKYLKPSSVKMLDKLNRLAFGKYVSIIPLGVYRFLPHLFTTVIVRPHAIGTIDFCAGCPDQTVIWQKTENKKVPIIVHSCLSPQFLSLGYSNEESQIVQKTERQPESKDVYVCNSTKYYSRRVEIISDWQQLTQYQTLPFKKQK